MKQADFFGAGGGVGGVPLSVSSQTFSWCDFLQHGG
jgi:hypothetical protein